MTEKREGEQIMRRNEPTRVFEIFDQISQIPRCTGDEEAVGDYLVQFAQEHRLEYERDEVGNVIIKKPGTSGYEAALPVILQGHMDMLCIKGQGVTHDFAKDPVFINVSGDLIMAQGTSLGSDNGIALAFYLRLLESRDIPHPPLEVLFTVQEEAGLIGARELDVSELKGHYLINMDSEAEGEFIVGCAGEVRLKMIMDADCVRHEFDTFSKITVSGLRGGHSGLNIHMNRGNAVEIVARIFKMLSDSMPVSLVSASAGEAYNVIPSYGELLIAFPHDARSCLKDRMSEIAAFLSNYVDEPDLDIQFEICPVESDVMVVDEDAAKRLIDQVLLLPIGVCSISTKGSNLVDTSLNAGVLRIHDGEAVVKVSVRGNLEDRMQALVDRVEIIGRLCGSKVLTVTTYPSWSDEGDNHLRRVFKQCYQEQYGEQPVLKSIHAGLECSILAQKLNERKFVPPIEMVSFGPDIFDAHTIDESVSISSVRRIWHLFQQVLKALGD